MAEMTESNKLNKCTYKLEIQILKNTKPQKRQAESDSRHEVKTGEPSG